MLIVEEMNHLPTSISISLYTPKDLSSPPTVSIHLGPSPILILTLDSPQIKKDSSSPIIIRDILPDPLDSPLACFAIERISSSEKNKKKKDEEEDGTSKNKRGRRLSGGKKKVGWTLFLFFFFSSVWLGVV